MRLSQSDAIPVKVTPSRTHSWQVWFARFVVAAVFAVNIHAALSFIGWPERYTAGFELSGPGAEVAVQAVGVLFLIWNATFPLVILDPARYRALFGVVVVQQMIAVAGDVGLRSVVSAGNGQLVTSVDRFIAFDGTGLLLMIAAFACLLQTQVGQRSVR